MNYTTVNSDCVCAKPIGSTPTGTPPPLPQQLTLLTEKVSCCADRLNRLSLFLSDTPIESDRVEEKCVSANLAYAFRMLDAFCNKLDYLNEVCR